MKKKRALIAILISILLIFCGKQFYDMQSNDFTRIPLSQIPVECIQVIKIASSSPRLIQQCFSEYQLVQNAKQYRKEKKYNLAESALRHALPVYEQCLGKNSAAVARLLFNLAGDCCEQHNFTEAVELYRRVIEIDLNRYGSRHFIVANDLEGLMYSLIKERNYSEALRVSHKLKEINPKSPAAYLGALDSEISLKEYASAIGDASVLILWYPKKSLYYHSRAEAYVGLGQYKNAIDDSMQEIRLGSNSASSYKCRGFCYYQLKQYDKALEDYNSAIKIDNKNAHTYHDRACVYDKLGQLNNAIDDDTKSILLDPSYRYAYAHRIHLHEKSRAPSLALRDKYMMSKLDCAKSKKQK